MWYFAWILGVLLACAFGIINVLWLEAQEGLDQRTSVLDPLTKLPTRFEFMDALENVMEQQKPDPQPFSLLLVSLDAFHPMRESCGEEGLDELILKVSDIIGTETRRQVDTISRYDAETFGVLLPGATREIAEATAKRIQENSVDLASKANCSSVLSIGIVECLGQADSEACENKLQTLLQKVAGELKKAKQIGLNAICCEAGG